MNKLIILVGFLILSMVNAETIPIFRTDFNDLTTDNLKIIVLYQYDNTSNRWIKNILFNETAPINIAVNKTFVAYVKVNEKSILSNFESNRAGDLIYHNGYLIIFGVSSLFALIFLIQLKGRVTRSGDRK